MILYRFFLLALLAIYSFPCFSAPPLDAQTASYLAPKLNSERIAYFFGNYGIEVLPHADFPNLRIANLHSIHEGKKIMRTLAVTDFSADLSDSILPIHREILAGQSIGLSFKKHGWDLEKTPLYFGRLPLPDAVCAEMAETDKTEAVFQIYRLTVRKGEKKCDYCTIAEIYSPQFLNAEWLHALYPEATQLPPPDEALQSRIQFLEAFLAIFQKSSLMP